MPSASIDDTEASSPDHRTGAPLSPFTSHTTTTCGLPQSYSTTVPYSSTEDTAEWIEETPLEIGTDAGFAALPNLTDPAFTNAEANGAPAGLTTSEEIQLTDSSGDVIGTPSAPNASGTGFSECTWTSTCS